MPELIISSLFAFTANGITLTAENYFAGEFMKLNAKSGRGPVSTGHRFTKKETVFLSLAQLAMAGLVIAAVLFSPPVTTAHPLDEFYQVTFITVSPGQVSMIVELYTGVLVAPQVIEMIDTDGNGHFSDDEQQAYVKRFLADVTFQIDGASTPLQIESLEFPTLLDLKAGVGVIRFYPYATFPAEHWDAHQLFYENNHFVEQGVYIVSALSGDPRWVQITHQDRDVFQKNMRLDYTIDENAPVAAVNRNTAPAETDINLPPGASTEGQRWLTGFLYQAKLPPLLMAFVLIASIVLGGLHALTPGHGKTLVAAYLIGSRGTVLHAMFLGGIVTFTHTASVIILGLLALVASQYIVPNVMVPALEVMSGLLVVYIGVQLIWSRLQLYQAGNETSHHHSHNHTHSHADSDTHHHHIPENVKLRDLLALGISGGMVPCPEALGIMLIAVGLNRILLGLGMVVAFSFGLAAVLIVIGIMLVRAKSLLDGISSAGQRWQTLLPLVSAVIVTLLGLGIVFKGMWPLLAGA